VATWAALAGNSTIMIRKNVAETLQDHVTFELEAIDRMYLNADVPSLQTGGGFVYFVKSQLGARVPSTMMVAPMSEGFVQAIDRFAATQGIPLVTFEKGPWKDDVAQPYLAKFKGEEGVLFLGKAQEKASVFRTEKRRDTQRKTYPWSIRSTAMPNHDYVRILDKDFGPLFIKFCSYFPYPAKIRLNWHEWLKRQLAQKAIPFEPFDNGIRSTETPARVQRIADTLDAAKIDAVFRKWLRRIPHPASLRASASRRWLSVSALDPPSRDRPDPGARSPRHGALLLRRSHPRESRPRSSRLEATHLRPWGHPPYPWELSDPRLERGSAVASRAVQKVQGQAVPQGRPGASDRNHHQRHL
jgi:hypothetical protein